MAENDKFTWPDYVVFSLMLIISAGIGVAFGYVDRKKKSSKDFLLGGGNLSVLPVGISILASFTSAIAILGFSTEMYKFGTMYWIIVFSYPLTQGLAALIFIPHFHRLGITSAYQYLEMRFNNYVRLAASFIFSFQMFLYMSVALYTPALAIEQVTGIPLWISIIGTGAICAFYTVVGGMKATVWIDTFQVGIMFVGLLLVVIKGSLSIDGGFKEVFNRASETSRLEFFDFDFNPFRRHTFWTLIIGGFFTNLTIYGSNQGTIQRYLTVKRWQDAAKALMINLVGGMALLTLTCLCGLVAYARYYKCDVLSNGSITKGEQLLPYLVMDILGELPGLPGLFVATIYSAALSTISAGMNSLAAVCITDFYKPYYRYKNGINLNENIAGLITKSLALGFGVGAIGLGYLCQYLGNTVLQLTLSIFGLLGGPLLGVISLGMFVPYANWVGALVGLVVSSIFNLWVGVGSVIYGKQSGLKSVTTENCTIKVDPTPMNDSSSSTIVTTLLTTLTESTTPAPPPTGIVYFYQLSYLYYAIQALIIVFGLGMLFSFIGYKKGWVERKPIEERLYVNRNLYKPRMVEREQESEKEKRENAFKESNAALEEYEMSFRKKNSNNKTHPTDSKQNSISMTRSSQNGHLRSSTPIRGGRRKHSSSR